MPLSRKTRAWLVISSAVGLCIFLLGSAQGVCHLTPQQAHESALRTDLQTIRQAIENYTLDRQAPPASLQDLVDAEYLRQIPVDPMTQESDWVTVFGDVEIVPGNKVPGIVDVQSRSSRRSSDKTPYKAW
jgi:general secretion pathway protein G